MNNDLVAKTFRICKKIPSGIADVFFWLCTTDQRVECWCKIGCTNIEELIFWYLSLYHKYLWTSFNRYCGKNAFEANMNGVHCAALSKGFSVGNLMQCSSICWLVWKVPSEKEEVGPEHKLPTLLNTVYIGYILPTHFVRYHWHSRDTSIYHITKLA